MILHSTITCPHCGFSKEETMPENACTFFYECGNCKTLLKPRQGDCCVFCSYGDIVCPPKQLQETCCTPGRDMPSFQQIEIEIDDIIDDEEKKS